MQESDFDGRDIADRIAPPRLDAAEERVSVVEIRAAAAADADALTPLLAELGYPTRPSELAARLAFLQGPESTVLVAVSPSGELTGLIGLHRLPTLHAPAPACYITALVVAESARGRGVGRRLLAAAEEWARGAGCNRLVVTSAEHRREAHAFYERCGFPYTGRRFVRVLVPAEDEGRSGHERDRVAR